MFLNMRNQDGHVAPFEQYPCSAITPKRGMLMKLSEGKLAAASGTDIPEFVCVEEHSAAVSAGDEVNVVRIEPGTVYETELSAAGSSLKLGNKVTIASDGLRVTATTAGGVAEIVYIDGTASGSMVQVRFPAAAESVSMSDLSDVDLSTPATNGQVLKYDGTATKWKPAADATA